MKKVMDFALRNIAGEDVLIPIGETTRKFTGMISLTPTARIIWENLEKVDSVEKIVDLIMEEYEVERETALQDTLFCIGKMMASGWIELSEPGGNW